MMVMRSISQLARSRGVMVVPVDGLAGARQLQLLHRVVGVARIAQVGEEAQQVLLVQQRELHVHGAGEEVDVARLARRRDEQLLPVDAVGEVEQLALRTDARDGVGPLQAPLLAEDVELS